MGFAEIAASFEVAVSDAGDFREDVAARPEEVNDAGVGLPTWCTCQPPQIETASSS